jgi:hypothetical protein
MLLDGWTDRYLFNDAVLIVGILSQIIWMDDAILWN